MIEVLLFDFDGVLRHFDHSRVPLIEREAGLPPGAIATVAFSDEYLLPAITGQMSDEAWRERIAEALEHTHPNARARAAVQEWSRSEGAIDTEMAALISECRKRFRVGLVSNATSRLARDMASLQVAELFDEIINSSEVGIAKPDRGIFDHALSKLNGSIGAAVFVDDALANVEAAKALGIAAVHHTSHAETRQALSALGLL